MSFNHVLVPLDGSQVAETAVDHAKRLVGASGGELHLLYVVSSKTPSGDNGIDPLDWRLQQARAQCYLDELAERLAAEGVRVTSYVDDGEPAERILEFAREHDIDLIVFSAYGHGDASRFHFGGTVQKAMRGTRTSIMVTRPGHTGDASISHGYRRVLVPLDGSYRAEWAACRIAALLRADEVELILLQVVVVPDELSPALTTCEVVALRERLLAEQRRAGQAYLNDVRRRMQQGLQIRTQIVRAHSAAREILRVAQAENVDLIAISAHGASDESGWELGSVADAVASHAEQPVLILQDLPSSAPPAANAQSSGRGFSGLYSDA